MTDKYAYAFEFYTPHNMLINGDVVILADDINKARDIAKEQFPHLTILSTRKLTDYHMDKDDVEEHLNVGYNTLMSNLKEYRKTDKGELDNFNLF